jgi:hypothetical protein
MPVEVDPPAKISWDERNDWAEVFAHFVDSGRTDFKPISTTTRGLVGIIITRYNIVLTTDFAGYTTVDPLPILIGLWNKEAHLRALLHRWLSVFSASFAFSCTVPDRLSPSPLRATSMVPDDLLLYHLFMSPNICCALYNYAFVSLHEHYPIHANSCFHYKWTSAGHHSVCVRARSKKSTTE